eukprot:GHVS01056671.1.p1 GENE.GHVS01056671.1~~GHVS01056671.1.p1  ORF type:complete len:137 (-),score=2.60 GHVS01056671.1:648-1058(-)
METKGNLTTRKIGIKTKLSKLAVELIVDSLSCMRDSEENMSYAIKDAWRERAAEKSGNCLGYYDLKPNFTSLNLFNLQPELFEADEGLNDCAKKMISSLKTGTLECFRYSSAQRLLMFMKNKNKNKNRLSKNLVIA